MPKQPNSDHCFVCGRDNPRGLRMVFHDDGEQVTSQTTVDEMFQGYPGIVHGGVVAAMLDEVVARVAMVQDHMHFLMSVRLAVKFRLPTPTSIPIRLLGRRIRDRGRFTEAQAQRVLPNYSRCKNLKHVIFGLLGHAVAVFREEMPIGSLRRIQWNAFKRFFGYTLWAGQLA
jgi:hypothetical protein